MHLYDMQVDFNINICPMFSLGYCWLALREMQDEDKKENVDNRRIRKGKEKIRIRKWEIFA